MPDMQPAPQLASILAPTPLCTVSHTQLHPHFHLQTYLVLICVDADTACTMPAYGGYGGLARRLLMPRVLLGGGSSASSDSSSGSGSSGEVGCAPAGDFSGGVCPAGQVQLYPAGAWRWGPWQGA